MESAIIGMKTESNNHATNLLCRILITCAKVIQRVETHKFCVDICYFYEIGQVVGNI
jgi:hypothetical protein